MQDVYMTREMDPDRKGPVEFFKFARRLPDDLWPFSIVVGAVFGMVWFLGLIFKKASTTSTEEER